MSDEPSRVEEYIGHAATLRLMAANTAYLEIRAKLLELAAFFDQLAAWEKEPRVGAAH
jgi:hypothetical protein